MNILIETFLQFFYIQNGDMCLKTFYQYFFVFFVLYGRASLLKTFYMSLHNTNNLKKTETTPDSLD